jgi:voltage-gated sodium channel
MAVEASPLAKNWLADWFESKAYELGITSLIIVNSLLMVLETIPRIEMTWGPLLNTVQGIVVAIFVLELSLKLAAIRAHFFRSAWNWFDVVVVGVSILPATEAFAALRALRAVRLLRVISVRPSLRRVVEGFLNAIPNLGSVIVLLLLILFVFALLGTRLFGGTHPELFGTLGASLFSLFTVMTLEGWNDMAWDVMEIHRSAWIFFISFIMITTWAVLNLFIGVIVDSMQQHTRSEEAALEQKILEKQTDLAEEVRLLRGQLVSLRAALEPQFAAANIQAANDESVAPTASRPTQD